MIPNELRIRDISRNPNNEWTPPIGAMGGPPAHELYRDLVLYAGLRLLRDQEGHPWIAMQDGERRRTFRVPGAELRGALDRFRMRRNLRPVPETDLEDFSRIVEARISDPDIRIPSLPDGAVPRIDPNDGSFPPVAPGAPVRRLLPIRENVTEGPDPAPAPEAGPRPTPSPVVHRPPAPPVPPKSMAASEVFVPDEDAILGPDLEEIPLEPTPSTTVRTGPSWVAHAARSPVRTNPEPEPGRWPVPPRPATATTPWTDDREPPPDPEPAPVAPAPAPALEQEVDAMLEELEDLPARRPRIPRLLAPAPPWSETGEPPVPSAAPAPPVSEAISGGRIALEDATGTLPTYLRVLKNLVSHGGWLGTTTDLARLTGEDPETVFASLLQYRPSLNQNNIVVATVEVEDGWRWLAVDRSKLQAGRSPEERYRI